MDRDPDKLRAWKRRGKPLKQGKGLQKKRPDHPTGHNSTLRPRNPVTAARRRENDEVYGSYHRAVTGLECWLKGHRKHKCRFFPKRPKIEGDHGKTIGSGGKDKSNEWPVCPGLHDLRHQKGVRYVCKRFGIDLKKVWSVDVPGKLQARGLL